MSAVYKKKQSTHNPFRVVIVGHVDHGKSTLIGRLLHDTGSLPDGKFEEIQGICEARRLDNIEWSFVLDAFQAERDQAITIDTTQIWFSSDTRDYVIIDAPGHREFLKNMISGAAAADAAILVVDACEGLQEQTRRHAYMLSLIGMKQISVVINKMDTQNYAQDVFTRVKAEVEDYMASIGLSAKSFIPISARKGDGIAAMGVNMGWFDGHDLVRTLDDFTRAAPAVDLPLRFPVQDVYRFGDDERIIVGRVESGTIKAGDTILFSPTNESAIVKSIEVWPENAAKDSASAGEVIGIKLSQRLFVERGHMASHAQHAPMLSNLFKVNLFWLSDEPLRVDNSYKVRCATHEMNVTVQSINRLINTDNLAQDNGGVALTRNNVADVTLRVHGLMALDAYIDNEITGRVVIYDKQNIVGGGLVDMDGYLDQRQLTAPKSQNIYKVNHLLSRDVRAQHMGQHGGVFWFTGLSGAGKSTIAMAVEQALFDKGYKTYVLDGDNVRHGLNKDLGFSPEDRQENIRRIGEVAALIADSGLIVITAFISPYAADRDQARSADPDHFHEIYIKADVATCESRDPKGLYKKARAGQIKDFTGIDSPYEHPENPDIIIDTQAHDIDHCVGQVLRYIESQAQYKATQTQQSKEKAFGT